MEELQKTQKVFNKDGSLYGEYHYLEFLKFKINYLKKSLKGNAPTLYYENNHGGKNKIDEFGNSIGWIPFNESLDFLSEIVKLEMDIQLNNLNKKQQ